MRRNYLVIDELGLHARPATLIVQEAGKYDNDINLIYKDRIVNAKSVMMVMSLAITVNTEFGIEVKGDNPEKIFESIESILKEHKII